MTVIHMVEYDEIAYWLNIMSLFLLISVAYCAHTAPNFWGRIFLVRAECVRCPWLLAQTKVATILHIFPLVLVAFTP